MIIGMDEFERYFRGFASSAVRIEALPVYDVPREREEFARYLAGAPLPEGRNAEWAGNIRRRAAEGKYLGRVRVIDHELTPYLQFELDWYYAVNAAAGEDIRFIFRKDVPDLVYADTWLFDDETVLDLSYTGNGRLVHINRNDSPKRLKQARTAWEEFHDLSFPLAELLALTRNSNIPVPRHPVG